jgi:N-acetylglucosaminyldiphosphoundecaprenol N-acetyl-beta-D-mannosaminyltransferase
MHNAGKRNILGVLIDVVDYEGAELAIISAAVEQKPMSVSALAVHGLMTGALDREQQFRLNQFSLLVPDGQPVRWALNWLHDAPLTDRVYGPNLTLRICARAATEGLPVYFYGGTPEILVLLKQSLRLRFPDLVIAGMESSQFRQLSVSEREQLAKRIRSSGAAILFVGLGCPRQEVFVYEFRELLSMPLLAVGAAFPFLAGVIPQAPSWMQKTGLEWLFRLSSEPRRLWRRYLFLNPAYLFLLTLQALGFSKFPTNGQSPTSELLYG